MNRNPMIPPNFVTLRQLKGKREQEEKLKEEEERLRKLKEEEEEERLRKLKEEEEASKTLRNHDRREWREVGPRRTANLDEHVVANGSPDLEGSKKNKRKKGSSRRKKEKEMTEMPISLDGSEKAEVIGSDSGPVPDIEKRVSGLKIGGRSPNPNRRGGGRGSRNWGRVAGDGMMELPLSLNGFGVRMNEKEETASKVTMEIIGSESGPVVDIEKRVLDLKLGGRNQNPNRRGRRSVGNGGHGAGDGMTELPLSCNGFGVLMNEKEEIASKVTVEVIGSESGPVVDIDKRVLDLKLGGRNPNPNRRGRRSVGNGGRGAGDGMTELPLSRNGFGVLMNEKEEIASKVTMEVIRSESGPVVDIDKRVLDLKLGGRNLNPNRRGRRSVGNWGHRGGGGGGMVWVKKMAKS